jgi:hypothetical protein
MKTLDEINRLIAATEAKRTICPRSQTWKRSRAQRFRLDSAHPGVFDPAQIGKFLPKIVNNLKPDTFVSSWFIIVTIYFNVRETQKPCQ